MIQLRSVRPKLAADQADIRRVIVADGDIKRPLRLEYPHARCHPLPRPVDVVLGLEVVLVPVVRKADIERRIGEHQVRKRFLGLLEQRDAIAAHNLIFKVLHGRQDTISPAVFKDEDSDLPNNSTEGGNLGMPTN